MEVKRLIPIILLLTCSVFAITKPLVPTDMPFVVDPNMHTSPILDWIIVEPNHSLVYALGFHNKAGMSVEIDVIGTAGEPIDTLVQTLGVAKDPDGGYNQYFQIAWTPPSEEKLHYLEIRATDVIGRQVRATLLVYAVYDDVPFFFPVHGPIPVSRIKQAQRMVQYAKKHQFPLTYNIAVR